MVKTRAFAPCARTDMTNKCDKCALGRPENSHAHRFLLPGRRTGGGSCYVGPMFLEGTVWHGGRCVLDDNAIVEAERQYLRDIGLVVLSREQAEGHSTWKLAEMYVTEPPKREPDRGQACVLVSAARLGLGLGPSKSIAKKKKDSVSSLVRPPARITTTTTPTSSSNKEGRP